MLLAPAHEATEGLRVQFDWTILHKRPGVTYCSTLVTDKGTNPFDGHYESRFPAGETEGLSVHLDRYYYLPSTFEWGVIVVACAAPGATCVDAPTPCGGRRLLSDVRLLHVR